jgi:uroporphyrinogen-III synthase
VTSLPLADRRILVTRAAHQAGKLSAGLRALGAEPVEVPVLEIRPPFSFDALDAALHQFFDSVQNKPTPCTVILSDTERSEGESKDLHLPFLDRVGDLCGRYDWLILTSANTVQALAERAAALGLALVQPPGLQVAAVGEATADAARLAGLQVALVPKAYVAESLVEGLLRSLRNKTSSQRILLARAATARDVIPDALRSAGAVVDVVDVYRNVLPEAAPEQLRQALAAGIDAATFTSSSSAMHLAEAARQAGIVWPFASVPAVSIGPITSQTLRDLGWEPAAEANPSDIPGLITAVVRVLAPGNAGNADSVV